jgi:hypothetical protein
MAANPDHVRQLLPAIRNHQVLNMLKTFLDVRSMGMNDGAPPQAHVFSVAPKKVYEHKMPENLPDCLGLLVADIEDFELTLDVAFIDCCYSINERLFEVIQAASPQESVAQARADLEGGGFPVEGIFLKKRLVCEGKPPKQFSPSKWKFGDECFLFSTKEKTGTMWTSTLEVTLNADKEKMQLHLLKKLKFAIDPLAMRRCLYTIEQLEG